ncbi:hypothetical protein AKJ41_06370 [candidate division MSBL1 archaeon SCGC-AAA259O05]|uniref:Uncharacterized protein n=1 Tax=candidate division MSBL1 archaeon SCGC-AAA259O05 TaxID=1698271 RepID=A0A133UX16_9EURY|nr:hypothetical protein AKJ41_06370 [candidate division MSBL1 archaeon SCGC-AAA259O05]
MKIQDLDLESILKKSDPVRFKSWLYHRGIFWDQFQDLDESSQYQFLLSFLEKRVPTWREK